MTNNSTPLTAQKKPSSANWYLVTNHLNLYYMMGAGLILPESGFGKKYYRDLLSLFPGHIVLFADTVPGGAIEMAKQEASHLIPCIANLTLNTLTGSVISIDRQGNIRQNLSFPNELDGNESALIIPAPLPISWVDKIYFESIDALRSFKESADDYNNVDHRHFMTKVHKRLFEKPKKDTQLFETQEAFPWPHAKDKIKDIPVCLNNSFAAGGIMAVLHKMADRSRSAAVAFQLAFDLDTDVSDMELDPLIHRPWQWVPDLMPATRGQLSAKMFWGAVDAIADCNRGGDINPKDAVFDFLKNVVDTWQGVADNEKLKNALQNLILELESLNGISDSTISQLLDRHPKSFSRAVILFFLRDNCQGLLEYHNEKLNKSDTIAAAYLFGARAGWLALPNDLKGSKPLQDAVVHRMAAMAHGLSDTGIGLGAATPPPPIFRELFKMVDNKWTVKQKNAALLLSKHKHWDCIQTVIDLGKGEYQLKVGGTGLQIVISGTEKNVTHEVDQSSFLKQLDTQLSEHEISGRLNQDLRKIFGCSQ